MADCGCAADRDVLRGVRGTPRTSASLRAVASQGTRGGGGPRMPSGLGEPIHVMFFYMDHFEPGHATNRMQRWEREYPAFAQKHRDHEKRPVQHTWTYPVEQPIATNLIALDASRVGRVRGSRGSLPPFDAQRARSPCAIRGGARPHSAMAFVSSSSTGLAARSTGRHSSASFTATSRSTTAGSRNSAVSTRNSSC